MASAGSNFAALLVNDSTTTSIGEETAGGYYGHNGHIPLAYVLPKSKIRTFFLLSIYSNMWMKSPINCMVGECYLIIL